LELPLREDVLLRDDALNVPVGPFAEVVARAPRREKQRNEGNRGKEGKAACRSVHSAPVQSPETGVFSTFDIDRTV
jgi:hypothetical protein